MAIVACSRLYYLHRQIYMLEYTILYYKFSFSIFQYIKSLYRIGEIAERREMNKLSGCHFISLVLLCCVNIVNTICYLIYALVYEYSSIVFIYVLYNIKC